MPSLVAACLVAVTLSTGAPPADASVHWSFRPVARPPLPAVHDSACSGNPIDRFVLSRLERAGLHPTGPADRRTLLRRVTLDLIGLPPSLEEQQAFLADRSPDAYERVVERLLASPHYGERWGRHWLDVARYADTNGYERDGNKPSAWRYRDYVIRSLNADKPFDQFLTEQLAGDEVTGANAETQIATSFLRLGTWDDEPADPLVDRYDQLDDVLGTTASVFLGLTLRCARCHDHKFEPFTQADYYGMLAAFEPLLRPRNSLDELDRPVGTDAELATWELAHRKWEASLGFVRAEIAAAKKAGRDKARTQRLEKQLAPLLTSQPPEPPHGYIWYEAGPTAPVTHILHRGDPRKPRGDVTPAMPAVLVRDKGRAELPRSLGRTTGRRLWLAHWMTRPENPLVARVIVNRIWQYHFGEGLVATPDDFGVMGQSPSHPELLDWLAAELVAGGWRLKPLHRLIVLSSTYRQAAATDSSVARADPDGRLLGRWRPRRLEAEALRDSILTVSGGLNTQMNGPGVFPPLPRAVLEGQSRPGDGWGKSDTHQASRRSVYVFVKRSLAIPELDLLDAPDTTCSCGRRVVSTTGPQALTFLNGAFVQAEADWFAARLRREAGSEPRAQVRRAFELALCRQPEETELRAVEAFLARQARRGLEAFCLVLLNTNEFAYLR
jgi:hypothetical protein